MPSRSRRFLAAGVHLCVSLLVAALAAFVVFHWWYPPPFDSLAGGAKLFVLLVGVDVVLGPVLTALIAAPGKPVQELRRDLSIIVAIQVVALVYGLYSIAAARPVFLSFEVDRFRVVSAADVEPSLLPQALPQFRSLSWTGPRTIAAIKPTDPDEQLKAIDLGLAGIDLSMIPKYWRPYESRSSDAWRHGRPLEVLLRRYPAVSEKAHAIVRDAYESDSAVRFLPVLSRHSSWVALLAGENARVIGFLPVDGFF